ncbi:MAG: hypothetical protein II341_06885 [Oscillospiraceae bacterium]|nr:hypothetical protein [Oscillospiraceae bacterium]
MNFYTAKADTAAERRVAVDDMILTKTMPTAAGSRMLDGYMSLFDAEVITRLENAGYAIAGKTDVGEFAIDLVGETSYHGAGTENGTLLSASAEAIKSGDVPAVVCFDVNGSVCRAAAQNGLVSVKPTYGTVSRYGTIPAACSGETVSVMADSTAKCREILDVLAGHDDKDGTSLSEEQCALVKTAAAKPAAKVAVLTNFCEAVDDAVSAKLAAAKAALTAQGVEICEIADETIAAARAAWNILMCSELCNNVSRYDGVKYGYRTQNFTNIDELYTNSRTEAFGELLKTAILFGSDNLSTENYMKVYDKALRIRRVVCEAFEELFKAYDAVLLPACSRLAYTEAETKADKYLAFEENQYTAPASITGLPAVTAGSVQLIGSMFSENMLFETAKLLAKEGE